MKIVKNKKALKKQRGNNLKDQLMTFCIMESKRCQLSRQYIRSKEEDAIDQILLCHKLRTEN